MDNGELEEYLDGLEAAERLNEPGEDYKIVFERLLNAKEFQPENPDKP